MHAALEDSRRKVQMQYFRAYACVFQLGSQQTSRRINSGGRMDEDKFQGMDKSKGFRR